MYIRLLIYNFQLLVFQPYYKTDGPLKSEVILKIDWFFIFQTIYQKGDYIVRQGTHGDTFYIISEGQVRITKRVEGNSKYTYATAMVIYIGDDE